MADAVDLIVPPLGESITEAVIARWLSNVGDAVAMDQPVAELETDKVTVALPSSAAGTLASQAFPEGATVRVGDMIGRVSIGAAASATPAVPAPVSSPAPVVAAAPVAAAPVAAAPVAVTAAPVVSAAPTTELPHRPLSPAQRKALLDLHGAELAHDAPPAPVKVAAAPVAAPVATASPAAVAPSGSARADEEVVAMSPLRRTIASRLVEAQHTAAILTTFNEVDMSAVMELRARYQDDFVKKHGLKLGFMSFVAKACVESLKEFPGVNAELRGTSIVYKRHYDIGVAVGGGKGLVVPVVRGVDRLSFPEIEKAVADLGTRAKESKLTLDELSGGTFSITNGGIYGSMMSTPLLNMPQTGILGMHNIVRRPVAVGSGASERIEIRPMMYLALSYDHRVVDGREAVQFLVAVKQRIEAPERLLFAI